MSAALTTAAIDGIVLAAGRSARMGRPKPLLRVDGETFLERAIRRLTAGGCRSVSVVVNDRDGAVPRLARTLGAAVVVNPDSSSAQIDSVRLALANLPPDSSAVVVLPVDAPLVAIATVAAVIAAYRARRAPLVLPVHAGKDGHPVLLARATFASILRDDLPEGLHSVMQSRADTIERVPVDDDGTLSDIDTPEQYENMSRRSAVDRQQSQKSKAES
ncbi:MAG: nucleotidyltransferase family protein [Longimicrobiales bacterium]